MEVSCFERYEGFFYKAFTGVKLSARPLALATISLVWAHEIIKAFAHLATVNFNIIDM